MKTGRLDLDATIKVHQIPSDEPTFILRAQDPVAAAAVRAWAHLAQEANAPAAVLEQALRQADAMEAWPIRKLPNADHLTEDENNNLAYNFERRAWNAREDALDPRIALAEARGFRAGINSVRAALGYMVEDVSAQIKAGEEALG